MLAVLILGLAGIVALAGPAAAATTASFSASGWDSGFTGQYTISNSGPGAVNAWQLEFDLPAGTQVGSFWDANMTRSGNHYAFTNRNYNGTIAVGASVSFGFVASGTGRPANCTVNGASCGGGGTTTTTRPPTSTSGPTTTTRPPTTTTLPNGGGAMAAAPYLYFGWGSPPSPSQVMSATGVRWFTLAFILSNGGCAPAWDGQRPLNGSDATQINQIRAAGGDVIPSFGGWAGNKLGLFCTSDTALANAYEQVINAYNLKAIDIDIENTEFESEAAQDRVIRALKIIKQRKPSVQTIVTMPVLQSGLNFWGNRMITRAAELGSPVDVWTIMPFNFGGGADMGQATVNSAEAFHRQLKTAFPSLSDDQIYRMSGISSMNGRTDQSEMVTQAHFQTMLSYARTHHLGRFTFWSTNRDRPCGGGGGSDACSGVSQQAWDFTKIVAQYAG